MSEKQLIPLDQDLTPSQIVDELDKYIIGQAEAKKAVAIALRNRSRRKHVESDLREEIAPKNIIMIGPTGVGKTEIARRLARISKAPFVKIEATKFTEVGYVGRDVESIVRDLLNIAIESEKLEYRKIVESEASLVVEDKLLDALLPGGTNRRPNNQNQSLSTSLTLPPPEQADTSKEQAEDQQKTREKFRDMLRNGKLEDKVIDIEQDKPRMRNTFIELGPDQGMEQMDQVLSNIMNQVNGGNKKKRKLPISEARKVLLEQAVEKLIDMDKVIARAIEHTEQMGIVFLDEVDKIASPENSRGGDVSRQGVQRDLLPLVEGSSVNTKYGVVKTDHILFIASGAFHMASPSDLIPELQGRFPIRVHLENLDVDALEKILTQPKNALTRQYEALLKTEKIDLVFEKDAIHEIAVLANQVNTDDDNIGARRLHTIMEKLLEELLFNAPKVDKKQVIKAEQVKSLLGEIKENKDLSKYIL